MLTPPFLMTAKHAHPNVRSEQDYRQQHRVAIAKLQQAYPNLPMRGVWESPDVPQPFVSGGRWVVECTTPGCGNCPMVAPGWGAEGLALACCYECGATYERIVMPAEADDIERLLVRRMQPGLRYWNPEVSLEHLRTHNGALGLEE
jgi:hypothetical protein